MTNVKRTDELMKVLGNIPVQIGLREQGHMGTVTKMLLAGASWKEIGNKIGWAADTARDWYAVEAAKTVSDYSLLLARLERMQKALKTLSEITCGCHSTGDPDWHSDRCFRKLVAEALEEKP